jgi:hypothetical protein
MKSTADIGARKMKKSSIILAVVSLLVAAFSAVCLIFSPAILGSGAYFAAFVPDALTNLVSALAEVFTFNFVAHPIYILIISLALLILAFVVIHIVFLAINRRPSAIFAGLAYLFVGLWGLLITIFAFAPGYFPSHSQANIFEVVAATTGGNLWYEALALTPYVLGWIAFVLAIIAIAISLADVIKNPGVKKVLSPEEKRSETKKENELKKLLAGELAVYANPTIIENKDRHLVVQYVYGGLRQVELGHPEPLTAQDVRLLVSEAIKAKQAKAKSGAALTAEDVRSIIKEEVLKANKAVPNEKVEFTPEEVNHLVEETTHVHGEGEHPDFRTLIRDELAKFRAEEKEQEDKAAIYAEEARKVEEARALQEAKDEEARFNVLRSSALSPEQIRAIIVEELGKKLVAVPSQPEVKPIEEKPSPSTAEQPATIVAPAPAEAVKPVVTETPVIVAAPTKRVVGQFNLTLPPHAKIIRIPFPARMASSSKELQSNYNELKAEAVAYGLKSRISNSGDTFRLHTKTYLKITIAGKGLKIYYALDPKDYANSPIPLHDAGKKNIYKEIPGVFRVKSDLSLRRAKQLIAEAVAKDKLEQDKIEPHNWAAELKDFKPQNSDKDD